MDQPRTNMGPSDLTEIAFFAALIAICAWISIPMPAAAPFTLQYFGVFTALCILGGKKGSISIFLYILLGAVGLPVFSGFSGGFGAIFGITGGYIIGFLACGLIYWGITAVWKTESTVKSVCALLSGLFTGYLFGTAWFMVLYVHQYGAVSFRYVVMLCVIPYILPDLIKMGLAVTISKLLLKYSGLYG